MRQEVNDTMRLDANLCLFAPGGSTDATFYFCCPCVRVFIGLFVSRLPYWLQKMQITGLDISSNRTRHSILNLKNAKSRLHGVMHD